MSKDDPDRYERDIAELFGKLREAWERAIEECLLNEVVLRFRPGVETQRLKRVTIESSDYAAIDKGMALCSTHLAGHDAAAGRALALPTVQDLTDALKELEDFVVAIRKRQAASGKTADALLDPPAPQVSTVRATTVIQLDHTARTTA